MKMKADTQRITTDHRNMYGWDLNIPDIDWPSGQIVVLNTEKILTKSYKLSLTTIHCINR